MSAFDNLFAARSYESIGSNRRFLELFSANILDAIDVDSFQNKVTIFRSGPGGGKTSLLQLFGPEPLRRISGNREVNREVYARLKRLGALADAGPSVLSIYHRMDMYDALQGGAQDADARGLFTLVGARLVMRWIAGLLSLRGLGHDQMDKIRIGIPRSGRTLPGSPVPCSGKRLYDWAARTEEAICSAVGSLDDGPAEKVPMFMGLDHIHVMAPEHVTVGGEAIEARPLIALDDLHGLDKKQRLSLIEHMCRERYPAPVWLAERLDAVSLRNLFGGINGREYKVVHLEEHWERKRTAFESFARSISEKRTQDVGVGLEISSLPDHLDDAIAPGLDAKVKDALKKVEGRVRGRSAHSRAYDGWIDSIAGSDVSSLAESLLLWRMLEIRIVRDENRKVARLVDAPLDTAGGDDDGGVREAAELMLSSEFDLPYYYGFRRIAALATFNIELFLEIASDVMDRLVAQMLRNPRDYKVSAADQEEIIKDVARRHWGEIEETNRNGIDVKRFLGSFCAFAVGASKPNVPYPPGVTGFEITRSAWSAISDPQTDDLQRVAGVLQTCLAQNYLKLQTIRQGQRGSEPKTILYLNRLLCANAGLPVGRGGWRTPSTGELVGWLKGEGGAGRGRAA